MGDTRATVAGKVGGNAAMALGGTDKEGGIVDTDASGAQCLVQTKWSASECIMLGQAAAVDVPYRAVDVMILEGAMHA